MSAHDEVNHPKHYTQRPSGVECIAITEHMSFNAGNAVKYLWRAGLKTAGAESSHIEKHLQDLKKAVWYVSREIEKLEKVASHPYMVRAGSISAEDLAKFKNGPAHGIVQIGEDNRPVRVRKKLTPAEIEALIGRPRSPATMNKLQNQQFYDKTYAADQVIPLGNPGSIIEIDGELIAKVGFHEAINITLQKQEAQAGLADAPITPEPIGLRVPVKRPGITVDGKSFLFKDQPIVAGQWVTLTGDAEDIWQIIQIFGDLLGTMEVFHPRLNLQRHILGRNIFNVVAAPK